MTNAVYMYNAQIALPEVMFWYSQMLKTITWIPMVKLQALITMQLHFLHLIQPTFLKFKTKKLIKVD